MSSTSITPPTIDPVAAARWHAAAPAVSPWLHEEVGRRMQDRLQWITRTPQSWCNWEAVRGGLAAHALVAARFPQAECVVVETTAVREAAARSALERPWWNPARWRSPVPRVGLPADASVQMLWSNMVLHMAADPQGLIARWHRALATDGYLMFSCLGPDTAREIRDLYQDLGWQPAGHAFTDMHDWGDMLVHAGFAEPVMDMERITLTYTDPRRVLGDLQELGCNLHPQRFQGLRGREWRNRLEHELAKRLASNAHGGHMVLTFEIIYGHAFKPQPRVRMSDTSVVPLQDMRAVLRSRSKPE